MMDANEPLLLAAEWTDDCCGKKDYDGNILAVSSRYWPRLPSATSSLIIWHGPPEEGDYTKLVSENFSGESFAEVATQVEAWAQRMMERAVAALQTEFGG